ncbi:unnamed protein product [Cyprideis torosa]|uniref:Uncharacterized protein n=1 Tax=Cyprideis torosa TaxID=163714 RepID=A0A7R8ZN27_9CRUS|nr:unnamed protein product [Cyprideis torosa]CAG0885671.1 unnamed protein product [Cyprideis torosa]
MNTFDLFITTCLFLAAADGSMINIPMDFKGLKIRLKRDVDEGLLERRQLSLKPPVPGAAPAEFSNDLIGIFALEMGSASQNAALKKLEYQLESNLGPTLKEAIKEHNDSFQLQPTDESNNRLENGILKGLSDFQILSPPVASIREAAVEGGKKMEKILDINTRIAFNELVAEYDVHSKVGLIPVSGRAIVRFKNATLPVQLETSESKAEKLIEEGACFGIATTILEAAPEIEVNMNSFIGNVIKTVFSWFGAAVDDKIFANLTQIISDLILKAIQMIICTGLIALGGAVAGAAVG